MNGRIDVPLVLRAINSPPPERYSTALITKEPLSEIGVKVSCP